MCLIKKQKEASTMLYNKNISCKYPVQCLRSELGSRLAGHRTGSLIRTVVSELTIHLTPDTHVAGAGHQNVF